MVFTKEEEAGQMNFTVDRFLRRIIFADGTVLPLVSGGAEEEEEEEEEEEDKPKTFTQAEVNRISAKEKREGKKAAIKEFLAELGVEGLESEADLKKAVQNQKKSGQEESEALVELRDSLAKAQSDLEKANDKLASNTLRGKIVDALIEEGMTAKAARKASRLVEVDAKAEDDEITGAVEELKAEMPNLFSVSNATDDDAEDKDRGGSKNQGKNSDAGPPPRKKGQQQETPESRAKARLAKDYPKKFGPQTQNA